MSCSPVSASSTTITPGVGQLVLARVERGGSRRPRGARSAAAAAAPSPARVMKSETRTTSERRRIAPSAYSSSPVRSVIAPFALGRPQQAPRRARAPGCGCSAAGACSSISLSKRIAPTRLPPRVSSRAKVVASSQSTSSFGRSIGPKPIDGDRSSSSQAVSSRSSEYWRTYGVSIRAVTFQSMWRTSSPGSYSRRSRKSSPDPAEDRAVVALQEAVEAADHLPLEAVQELLGRRGAEWSRCRPCVALRSRRRRGPCAPAARAREPGRRRGCGR